MCRELKHIDNGINHIRLDHDILKTERWNRLCGPSTTHVHKQGLDIYPLLQLGVLGMLRSEQAHLG